MNRMKIDDVAAAARGRLVARGTRQYISGVKHDSRECGEGDLFVAICGEKNDGHDYIPQVIKKGCRVLLVSHVGDWMETADSCGAAVIMVEDTVLAMGELAKSYLASLNIKKVAVTGSVGKTTVRDMIYYVLSEKYNCGRNMKNFNNDIGLPLSIFTFDKDTQVAVLEMGMSGFGEIDRLAEIADPDIAVITNIGVAHIEKLGSREGIFRAKMEVASHIPPASEGGALVYAASDMLNADSTAGRYRSISVGGDSGNDYVISSVDDRGIEGIQFTLEFPEGKRDINLPVPGRHNAVNAALAVAVGRLLGVSVDDAARGLARTKLTDRRLNLLRGKNINVIDDTYNANPDSMRGALETLGKSRTKGERVAILGDMYELGRQSEKEHSDIGLFAGESGADRIVAVGKKARKIAEGASNGETDVSYFKTKQDLIDNLGKIVKPGDLVLVKGSRGMKMEDIVQELLDYGER